MNHSQPWAETTTTSTEAIECECTNDFPRSFVDTCVCVPADHQRIDFCCLCLGDDVMLPHVTFFYFILTIYSGRNM